MIIAHFAIAKEKLSLMEGYVRTRGILDSLSDIYPAESWHRLPRQQSESNAGWIRVLNEDKYLRSTARDMGDVEAQWPALGSGFEAVLTTASSVAAWDEGGQIVMTFSPKAGELQLEIFEADSGMLMTYGNLRAIFIAICSLLDVSYARCDVTAPSTNAKETRNKAYSMDHRVFPHREFLGWIGFVNMEIARIDLPEADEIIPIPEKKGTVIVAVADAFNVHDRAQVERAQRVEMRLVDLGALPVIAPDLLN